jgi:thioredoxin-dependent peroxiredoxin
MTVTSGSLAPDFQLPDETGKIRSLLEFKGKMIVLYFYPKDDTPGCTTEACEFRDAYADYEKAGVVILGVSPDASKSHTKFIQKFSLPFPLLADADHAVCQAYGVWGPKKFMRREYDGVLRTTFLIGPDGIVLKVFEGVKPAGHAVEVLAAIK